MMICMSFRANSISSALNLKFFSSHYYNFMPGCFNSSCFMNCYMTCFTSYNCLIWFKVWEIANMLLEFLQLKSMLVSCFASNLFLITSFASLENSSSPYPTVESKFVFSQVLLIFSDELLHCKSLLKLNISFPSYIFIFFKILFLSNINFSKKSFKYWKFGKISLLISE